VSDVVAPLPWVVYPIFQTHRLLLTTKQGKSICCNGGREAQAELFL